MNMPRQRTHHSRRTYDFPGDFPERFREASGMTWAELCRLGTHPHTMRRWRNEGVPPNTRHMMALLALAESLSLDPLLKTEDRHPAWPGRNPDPSPGDAVPGKTIAGGILP